MNIPRLKRMIAVLEEVEAKHAGHFDMDHWVYSGNYAIHGIMAMESAKKHECGSTACAVGWYCINNPDVGLIWKPNGFINVGEHFDITTNEAAHLFDPEEYDTWDYGEDGQFKEGVTPRHVINRIREMIGEGV